MVAKDKKVRKLDDFAGIASDWFWETDHEHRFTYVSTVLEQVVGIKPADIIGTRRDDFGAANAKDPKWINHLADLYAHRPFRDFEYSVIRPTDSTCVWLRVAGQPLFDDAGEFIGYRGTGHDITPQRDTIQRLKESNAQLAERNRQLDEARNALERAAYEDALTGLPNRRAFERDLADLMAQPSGQIALLHVDLDRFKWVNDSLGHQAGDTVLAAAANRIGSVVQGIGSVYRVGGDEFLIILTEEVTSAKASWIGDGIIEKMVEPFDCDQKTATVGASIGVAFSHPEMGSPAKLIAQADVALYEAKRGGRNTMCHLTQDMQDRMQAQREFAAEFPRAIDAGELIPYFQPQVHVGTGAVLGAEALVRWRHPIRGILPPSTFVETASALGLVTTIDRLMMRTALQAATRLRTQGLVLPSVSVNISAARLMDPMLPRDVEELWQDRRCKLCVELLETIHFDDIADNPIVAANLASLRELGVRIETDDFGSGRASITGLLVVRPDRLKIDRALVQAAVNDPVKRSVVAAILDMTRALGIEGMAEGVETQADIDSIRALGCHIFQGYAISHPLSEAGLAAFLAQRHLPSRTQTAGPMDLPKHA